MRAILTSFAASSIDVHHAPVTDSDAPLIFVAFQFLASCGPGIIGKRQNLPVDAVNSGSPSASNSFCADCLISREYLSTRAGAFQAAGAVLFVRNALFLSARFRNQPVREVLPDGPVCFQID